MAISSRAARLAPVPRRVGRPARGALDPRVDARPVRDNYGPEAQRDQQDRSIARWALADTGIEWQVAHSGRTVSSTAQFREMVARAGRDYDVLLVGYVSRFTRNLHSAVNARQDLHAAGAAILFCDERVLSSDENEWEAWARETVEAEAYGRRLGSGSAKATLPSSAGLRTPADTRPWAFGAPSSGPRRSRSTRSLSTSRSSSSWSTPAQARQFTSSPALTA